MEGQKYCVASDQHTKQFSISEYNSIVVEVIKTNAQMESLIQKIQQLISPQDVFFSKKFGDGTQLIKSDAFISLNTTIPDESGENNRAYFRFMLPEKLLPPPLHNDVISSPSTPAASLEVEMDLDDETKELLGVPLPEDDEKPGTLFVLDENRQLSKYAVIPTSLPSSRVRFQKDDMSKNLIKSPLQMNDFTIIDAVLKKLEEELSSKYRSHIQ